MVALFVNLKTALDSMDRGVLMEVMKEREIKEGLAKRIGRLLRETRSRVREGWEKVSGRQGE